MAGIVSITLQNNDEARPVIESILHDNPSASANYMPGAVKIDCPERLVVKAGSVSERIGRDWDPQEIHLTIVSMGGSLDEDDEELVLSWGV
ncbi:MAG: MmoB/DmpM family protein [Candidatus Thiodiazotropha sp. (ex Lucina aurantia)]|uniref:Phenol hydroxylase P2 protein n=2 Tax=Candidatus Thiodiazotropha TaxID=1913444 RepID=A0A7Z0VQ11_9GAMM|nr:MmoB/DmpM family protein [Candidatus Thiodiazotropha endolucinida]MBT3010839.1 MmoB/DmpM family protein [Candidatus Thiodiazotropha sp. (ex Lucina pensylvanica)]MBT3015178.1 MmoB/DmpM family protein [Candidatus Thiodiazotropha taylori]MBT3037680.1 MmoB/DmpM family protein [Candidatus Thiodiazotropha sp. (ex Codakia orbicularis)]MBV2101522.1 MmoB/DmpM family protein [Candidatus Thiodiazotropha sp. (ex Lucina aurantia)]MCU7941665.1 MmoB/DmpM family protein [Candidatus Thiodiazotropha sp. (ex 